MTNRNGTNQASLFSRDDGKTWKMMSIEQLPALQGLAAIGDRVLAVGEKGTLLQVETSNLK